MIDSTTKTELLNLADRLRSRIEALPTSTPSPDPDGTPLRQTGSEILLDQPGRYCLAEDLEFAETGIWLAAPEITLDLNGHTIRSAQHEQVNAQSGVRLYTHWADGEWFGKKPEPENCRIVGPGRIIMGPGGGNDAISGWRAYGVQVEGVYCEVSGKDAAAFRVGSGEGQISKCVFLSKVTSTANRHALPAVVESQGGLSVIDTAIIGGNVGLYLGSNSLVRRCFVSVDSFATNGYAVALYRNNNVLVEDNLLLANNGRGVLFNGGSNHTVRNNLILAREKANPEYGHKLNANCIRSRYDSMGHVVENNHCLAIGGAPWTGGSGLYLSDKPGTENTYQNNRFASVMVGDPQHLDHYAKAITLEAQGEPGKPSLDVIADNILEGNHYLLSVSGRDGWTVGAHNAPVVGNGFHLRDGAEVIGDFVQAVEKHWGVLDIENTVARLRYAVIISSLKTLTNIGLRPDAAHVWGDAQQWNTPVDLVVQGSGPYDDWVVSLNEHADWPMKIILE